MRLSVTSFTKDNGIIQRKTEMGMISKIFNMMNMTVRLMTATWTFFKKIFATLTAYVAVQTKNKFSPSGMFCLFTDCCMVNRNATPPIRVCTSLFLAHFRFSQIYTMGNAKWTALKMYFSWTRRNPIFFHSGVDNRFATSELLGNFFICLAFVDIFLLQ